MIVLIYTTAAGEPEGLLIRRRFSFPEARISRFWRRRHRGISATDAGRERCECARNECEGSSVSHNLPSLTCGFCETAKGAAMGKGDAEQPL